MAVDSASDFSSFATFVRLLLLDFLLGDLVGEVRPRRREAIPAVWERGRGLELLLRRLLVLLLERKVFCFFCLLWERGRGLELLLRLRRLLVLLLEREVFCFCCLFLTCRVKSLKVKRRLDMGKCLCLIMSCSSLEDLDFLPQLCNVRDKAEGFRV